MTVDPRNSSTVYAVAGGILRSTDGGAAWTPTGSIEGVARMIVIDPHDSSTLYAGTAAARGVFKSTDSGASWFPVNSGLPTYIPGPDQSRNISDVTSLVVDPANPSTLYIAVARGGVYKSTNGGMSWRAQNSGLPNIAVSAIAIHPANSAVLYAALYCGAPVAPGFHCEGGIFRSTDGGQSWHDVSSGLQSRDI